MYFWRIFKLRRQLADAPLPAKQALSYLLALVIFNFVRVMLQINFDFFSKAHRFPLYFSLMFIIQVIGIYACYQANGAAKGISFLSKFIALAWVLLCRFIVFGTIIVAIGLSIIELIVQQQHQLLAPHLWWLTIFFLLWLGVYYWRLSIHIKATV